MLRLTVIAMSLCCGVPCAFAQTDWPNQREADFLMKDFRFGSGETLPELRMHYVTLGHAETQRGGRDRQWRPAAPRHERVEQRLAHAGARQRAVRQG